MAKEFAKKFYHSDKWIKCRNAYISERVSVDGGLCEICREVPGIELHHKIVLNPANINDPEITLNHNNLVWLCKDCHFKQHRELIMKGFDYSKKKNILNNGMYFDEEGQIQPFKVYIIYGSPAAGKTSYVKQHMKTGDIVVDLDLIKQSISMCDKLNTPDNLLDAAISVRECLYSLIANRKIDCKNAWVIASLPKKSERLELAERLRAELIFIEANYHKCIDRAKADNERTDKNKALYVIDKWFENYEP